MTTEKLTPRQERFVKEYLVDLNGTQAAIRAGYSRHTANEQAARLLAKVSVRRAVDAAKERRSARTQINSDYVLQTIQETVERCRQAAPVLDRYGKPVLVETPEGEIRPAFTFEPQAVLKGAELLGKHLKLFTDKIALGGDGDAPPLQIESLGLSGLSAQELDTLKRLIAKGREALDASAA